MKNFPSREGVKPEDLTDLASHIFNDTDPPRAGQKLGADILHNNFVLTKELSLASIIQNQATDETFSDPVRNFHLKFDSLPDMEGKLIDSFTIIKGALMRVVDLEKPLEASNLRLCIPRCLLDTLCASAHVLYGHMGHVALFKILACTYYAPKLRAAVRRLVEGCAFCSLYRVNNYRKAPITGFRLAEGPMSIVSMDHFSLPKSGPFKVVLLVMDNYSSYTWAFSCRDESARTVANCLDLIFSWFGPCQMLKSDGGPALIKSKAVKAVMDKYGITNSSVSLPYSPFHNAAIERQVRSYRELLRQEAFANNANWPRQLRRINLIRNMLPRVYSNKLFLSPFELFFNRKYHPVLASP